MIRRRSVGLRALLAFAPLLSVGPALAQAPQASPVAQEKAAAAANPAGKPENKGEKAGPKGDDKAAKAETNPAKAENKAGEPTVNAVDRREPDDAKSKERLLRRKGQQDEERTKLRGQPMSEAMKEELSRHARRLARLERIKALAVEAKDTAVVERVTKLIEKENARHDKFTAHFESKVDKDKDDKGDKVDKGKDDKGEKGKDDKGKGEKGKDDNKGKDEKGGAK